VFIKKSLVSFFSTTKKLKSFNFATILYLGINKESEYLRRKKNYPIVKTHTKYFHKTIAHRLSSMELKTTGHKTP